MFVILALYLWKMLQSASSEVSNDSAERASLMDQDTSGDNITSLLPKSIPTTISILHLARPANPEKLSSKPHHSFETHTSKTVTIQSTSTHNPYFVGNAILNINQ